MSTAVKLNDDIVESAREESKVWSRSMTQQVEHWARIGRALERAGTASLDRIRAALNGELEFDALGPDERILALSSMEQAVVQRDGDPDLARELAKDPVAKSTVDEDGNVIEL